MVVTGPLVSIIIPSFNQGKYIRQTIDSCLAQDYRPIEVIVMDGASTDETCSVLKSFDAQELTWHSEPDRGVVDAVNKGLRAASGEILAIQSSDDLYYPRAVDRAVEAFESNTDAWLVYGDVELIDAEGRKVGADIQGPFDLGGYLGRDLYIPQPSAFFRRSAYETVGGWRAPFSYAADADFWLRIAYRSEVLKIDSAMGSYRYHDEQRDKQRARIARDWRAMIEDHIESGELPESYVRIARMGACLAEYMYAPPSARVQRAAALAKAIAWHPAAFVRPNFPRRSLLPFLGEVLSVAGRIKRRIAGGHI